MKRFILIFFFLLSFQLAGFAQQATPAAYYDSATNTQLDIIPDLRVYPNPVTSQKVTFEMDQSLMTEIRIVNIVGKEVLRKNFQFGVYSTQLQLGNIPKGMYLAQVKTEENKVVVKKLLVSDE